jgi:tetratricopeptide (TPR) repeat protein
LTIHLKSIFVYLTLFALLASCASVMPVEKAASVALQFQGTDPHAPPRGLGPEIESYIEEFGHETDTYVDCANVTEQMDEARIERIRQARKSDRNFYFLFQEMARREYFHGNVENAQYYASAAVKYAPCPVSKIECTYDKAWFFAEGGDFINATRAMKNALMQSSVIRESRQKKNERWRFKRAYLKANAQGAVHYAMGDMKNAIHSYQEAIAALLGARKKGLYFTYIRQTYLIDHLKTRIADCLIWQGRLAEAEIYAREALSGGDLAHSRTKEKVLPFIFITLSRIFHEQGKYPYAETTARIAVNMILKNQVPGSGCISKNAMVRARARHALAIALLAEGRSAGSLEQFEAIKNELRTTPDVYRRLFEGTVEHGLMLLSAGKPADALAQFMSAKDKLTERLGKDHYSVHEAEAFSAAAKARLGNADGAIEGFERSVPRLMSAWRDRDSQSFRHRDRTRRIETIIDAYIDLLTTDPDNDRIEKAFFLASSLQSRATSKSITDSTVRSSVDNSGLAERIRSKQDLEGQLSAHQNRIAAAYQNGMWKTNRDVITQLKRQRVDIQRALLSLEKAIEKEFPSYAAFFPAAGYFRGADKEASGDPGNNGNDFQWRPKHLCVDDRKNGTHRISPEQHREEGSGTAHCRHSKNHLPRAAPIP